jgi:hypothetical protein
MLNAVSYVKLGFVSPIDLVLQISDFWTGTVDVVTHPEHGIPSNATLKQSWLNSELECLI